MYSHIFLPFHYYNIIILNMINIDTTKTYIIVHKASQLALEAPINYTNYSKTSLQLGPQNESNPNQMWIFQLKQKNRYQIILGFPDVILTADGTDTTLKKGVGDKWHQYWEFNSSDPRGTKIVQCKHDNCYLGVNNHRIVVKKNPSSDQIDFWQFKQVTKNKQLNRCCYIKQIRTGKLMDVPSSQGAQGVHIGIWQPNYRFNQRWKIYRAGQVFIIKSFKTDLNLDIQGQHYQDGTKLIQWHSTGGNNQFWKFEQRDPGIYRISSWYDPSLQIGNDGKYMYLNKGQKYLWRIEGHIPEL